MDRLGAMDERIQLQAETATVDGIGGVTKAWVTFASVWAKVTPQRGQEAMQEGRMAASEAVKFMVYSRNDVTELTRIVWRGVNYNVRNVQSGSHRDLTMVVVAERGVAS